MEMPVQVEALVSSFKICSRKRIAPVAAINGDLIEASFNPSFSLGIEWNTRNIYRSWRGIKATLDRSFITYAFSIARITTDIWHPAKHIERVPCVFTRSRTVPTYLPSTPLHLGETGKIFKNFIPYIWNNISEFNSNFNYYCISEYRLKSINNTYSYTSPEELVWINSSYIFLFLKAIRDPLRSAARRKRGLESRVWSVLLGPTEPIWTDIFVHSLPLLAPRALC